MSPDLEKADHHGTALEPSCSSSSDDSSPPVTLEPIRTAHTTRSRRSSRSRRSTATERRLDGTDPYENLEHALTQDVDLAEHDDDDDNCRRRPAAACEPMTRARTAASVAASTASRPPDFEVIFEDADPENPRNWSLWYRAWILFAVAYTCWVTVLYSTSYTSSAPGLMADFGTSQTVTTLGMTTYLLGLAAGSLVLAPMSELFGRQAVYMSCLSVWALLIIPSGLARSFSTILAARFFW